MKKSRIWMSIVPVIAVMVTIFCFSAQPAQQSSETSIGIVEIIIKNTVPDYQQMKPEKQTQIREKITHAVRKCGHFTEFCALGIVTAIHAHIARKYKGRKDAKLKTFLITLSFCAVYAASDEIHQIFVPGRGPGVKDVLIDTSGALFGITAVMLALLAADAVRRRKNER